METSWGESGTQSGHINCWNVANALFWVANVGIFALAFFELIPGEAISVQHVLFEKYPTLLTPDPAVLRIFPVIFIAQGVFVFFQMTPIFRTNWIVTQITPWWIATQLIQIQWIVELSRDSPGSIGLSLACVMLMLGCILGMILVLDTHKQSFFEFWLLRAPFSIWAGWLICCSALNLNMWAASASPPFPPSTLLCIAMVSLMWIFVLTALFGVCTRRPDALLCIPVAWGTFWIWRGNAVIHPPLPEQMIVSVDIACAHMFSGVVVIGVMALCTRFMMVCVASKEIKEAYDEGDLAGVGQAIVM